MIQHKNKSYRCSLELTIALIGGKWKALIIWYLKGTTLRFNEIRKTFPDVTQKMLTQQLRDLEEDGIVHRKVYPQVPPKVEYSLTEFGESLIPVLEAMNQWGRDYYEKSASS
jgi:DNA-binding HxlR family transcriptional regulator